MSPESLPDQGGFVREWQACPVCQGRGVVPQGFYNPHPVVLSTSTTPDQCRTCRGARVIERPTAIALDESELSKEDS